MNLREVGRENLREVGREAGLGGEINQGLICILEAQCMDSCTKESLSLACSDQAKSVQQASDIPQEVPDCERV